MSDPHTHMCQQVYMMQGYHVCFLPKVRLIQVIFQEKLMVWDIITTSQWASFKEHVPLDERTT